MKKYKVNMTGTPNPSMIRVEVVKSQCCSFAMRPFGFRRAISVSLVRRKMTTPRVTSAAVTKDARRIDEFLRFRLFFSIISLLFLALSLAL